MEEWMTIEDFPKYAVSNLGRVKNIQSSIVLSPWISNSGYYMVALRDSYGIKHNHYIHRLVAKTFMNCNVSNMEINHINGCKLDNTLENLQWCTHSENTRHAIANGLFTPHYLPPRFETYRRVQIVETGEVFESISSCARHINRSFASVYDNIKGNTETCAGYHIILIEEEYPQE